MAGMVLGENEEKSQISSVQKHDEDLVLLISEIMEAILSCHFTPTLGGADVLGIKKTKKNREARGRIYSVSKSVPDKKNKYNFAEVLGRHKKLQKQIFDILLLSMLFFTMSAITAKSLFLSAS